MSHIVSSGKGKVYIQADVTNLPIFVRNPGWHLMFDQDAKMAEETRRKVYDMLVAEKMMVQGFHYPFPALAHIEKSGNGLSRDSGAVEPGALTRRRLRQATEGRSPRRRAAFSLRGRVDNIGSETVQIAAKRAQTRTPFTTSEGERHDRTDIPPCRARRLPPPRRCCRWLPARRQAAAPLAGTQAPGWYRYKVGTLRGDGRHRRHQPLQDGERSRHQPPAEPTSAPGRSPRIKTPTS